MFSRFKKSSLFHRSLAFVTGLLLVELSFVGFLVCQLHEEQINADKLRHSKAVVAYSERLLEIALQGMNFYRSGFLTGNFSHAGNFGPFAVSLREEVPQLLDGLEQLLADDAPRLAKVRNVHSMYNNLLTAIWGVRRQVDQANSSPFADPVAEYKRIHREVERLGESLNSLSVELFAICKDDRKVEQDNASLQDAHRSRMWVAFFGFAAFNIFAAIAAAIIFTRGLTSRIAVLVANTKNLGKRAPLLPRLGGGDEIAYLDEQFHAMAGALISAEAAERRALDLKKRADGHGHARPAFADAGHCRLF